MLSPQVEHQRRRKRAIPVDAPSFELKSLKKYTTYTIQVAAFTVDVGVRSPEMNVTTAEDGMKRTKQFFFFTIM